jgi:hypothetical protein
MAGFAQSGLGQLNYRSVATGNWDAIATWQSTAGTDVSAVWAAATDKPDANDTVYIQSSHVITLTQNEACYTLGFFKQTTTPVAAQGSLQLKSFVMELNGKLTGFSNVAPFTLPAVPATVLNLGSAWPLQTDAGTGTIKVVGNSRALTVTGGWGSGSGTSTSAMPNIEIALNAGQTVTMGTNVKFANWTLTSGTLDATTFSVSADIGTTLKNITILSGATFKSSNTSTANIIQRTSSTAIGVFTLNSGGTMILSGAAPKILATTITLNGTVEYNADGAQTLLTKGAVGADPGVYSTLILSTSGVKTLGLNTTVNTSFRITGTASLNEGGFTFTNNAADNVATLNDIKVNSISIAGFNKDILTYNVVLDYGTVVVPTLTWTLSAEKASASVTNAASLPGTSTILVTAENGSTTKTYSVNFTVSATPSSDASLKDLKVNGSTIPGFVSGTFEYYYSLPFGTAIIPVVSAVTNSAVANAVITQATSVTDMAFVEVTAQNGSTTLTYAIIFVTDPYIYKVGFETADLPFPKWAASNYIISTNFGTLPISNHATYPGAFAFRFIAPKPGGSATSGTLITSMYPNSGTIGFWLYVQLSDGNEKLLIHKKVKGATDSVLVAELTSAQMVSAGWKEFTLDINSSDSTSVTFTSVLTIDATSVSGGTRIWMDDLSLKGALSTRISKFDAGSPRVSLYPNPVLEQMTIDMNLADYEVMEVYNSLGSKVLTQKILDSRFDVNISNLIKGLYFVKFKGKGILYTTKFIKL